MSRFTFSFSSVAKEIESLKSMAHGFLEPETHWVLDDLKDQLAQVRHDKHRPSNWSMNLDPPLRTRPCGGRYQAGGRGHHDAFASISSIWEIQPLESDPEHHFEIVGNASCLVVVSETMGDGRIELGRFHIDIGIEGGPGAIFHAQIPDQPGAEVFPSTLDVPRFPIPPLSPLAVIEFVLGELFQEDWHREVSKQTASHTLWNGIQRDRIVNFLDWQLQTICGRKGDVSASPLMDLKHSRVEPTLFSGEFQRVFTSGC